ncbi:MAG: contractile injection system tape measure protein [Chitinophagaceae bacterium]
MQPVQHTIKKFSLELQLDKTEGAYQLQRRAIALIKNDLLAELNKVLTECFPGEDYMRINLLELNLGTINTGTFDKAFAESFITRLKEKLQLMRAASIAGIADENEVQYVTAKVNVLHQFLHFLANGTFVAPGRILPISQWQEEITQALREKPGVFVTLADRYRPFFRAMALRLSLQFDAAFIETLLSILVPEAVVLLQQVKQLESTILQNEIARVLRTRIRTLLFFYAIQSKPRPVIETLNIVIALLKAVSSNPPASRSIVAIPAALATLLQPVYNDQVIPVTKAAPSGNPEKEIKTAAQENNVTIETPLPSEEGVFVDNAGLVLLHPFLTNFFAALQLVKDNQFVDEAAQWKAVHLLQYLATGEEQVPEYCESLNKILCGLTAEEPVDRFVELSDAEKQEARELLQAVVGHWTALKSSSPEALQETFLQRKGKLRFVETDNYWKLQVEQKAFDILLDKLPWGFSYIQLPWMQYPLTTEWQ